MKNEKLKNLNFKKLLHYTNFPIAQDWYPKKLECVGFCVDCEEKGLPKKLNRKLTLMSHGCDSSDYFLLLGGLPGGEKKVDSPILFLLENPGADYDLGEMIKHNSYTKKPPTRHYYWMPDKITTWPTKFSDFKHNYYGPYFAYLMNKHNLENVYITNFIKCKDIVLDKSKPKNNISEIVDNCFKNFLRKEIEYFEPKYIFGFGDKVAKYYKKRIDNKKIKFIHLCHPSFIQNRTQIHGSTPEEALQWNDDCISSSLS